FTVSLPVQAPAPADTIEAAPEPPAVPRRVLVGDDNVDAADTLAMLPGDFGHEVQTAYDGQAALDAGETFAPDTVLLDIGMPHLNGYDAARLMRHRPWGAAALIVATTGWGQPRDVQRAREAG